MFAKDISSPGNVPRRGLRVTHNLQGCLKGDGRGRGEERQSRLPRREAASDNSAESRFATEPVAA